jgi:hypothetical protein
MKFSWIGYSQRFIFAMLLNAMSVGCDDHTSSQEEAADNTGGACVNSCETRDWPRVILGVVAQPGSTLKVVSASAVDQDGRALPNSGPGCPTNNELVCSSSWTTGPSDKSLGISVSISDGRVLTVDVPLAKHNYCARQISYVETIISTEDVEIRKPRRVSPCNGLNE